MEDSSGRSKTLLSKINPLSDLTFTLSILTSSRKFRNLVRGASVPIVITFSLDWRAPCQNPSNSGLSWHFLDQDGTPLWLLLLTFCWGRGRLASKCGLFMSTCVFCKRRIVWFRCVLSLGGLRAYLCSNINTLGLGWGQPPPSCPQDGRG